MADDVVKEDAGEEEQGGSKKILIFVVLALVLAAAGGIAYIMTKEDDLAGKAKEEEGEKYGELTPLLLVKVGEIECPMAKPAVGVARRKRLVLDPVILLKPFIDQKEQKPDTSRNSAMVKRFEAARPILRDIVIETVLLMESNKELDPKGLAQEIVKKINDFDNTQNDPSYKVVFGKNRVQTVYFNKFEPR